MDLISKSKIKNLLKKYCLRPSRGLGQNFLINKTVVKKIITAAELKPEDVVLEIGPGLGALTKELAKKVKMVIAVEKDPKMMAVLQETLKDYENVEVAQEDILKIFNFQFSIFNKFSISKFKIVANLPFYLTAPVIRKFLEAGSQPELMALVAQKEVAQRICAKPPKMSLLAVSVQLYAKPEIISYISKKSFWPQPKVDAAIIKLKIKNLKLKIDAKAFFRVVRAGFSQPRKMLINNLSKNLKVDKIKIEPWLCKNNIKPDRRAEALDTEDWINLLKSFKISQ